MLMLRVVAGIGGAAIWPAALAAIGDLFPYRQRAWAIGWLLGINALVPAVGVPAETLVAQQLGWRMAFFGLALLVAVAAISLAATLPSTLPGTGVPSSYLASYRAALRHADVLAMIGFGVLSHIFWHAALIYTPSFYQLTYGLSVGDLAPILAAVGLVGIAGNFVGGRAAGRFGSKPVAIASLLAISLLLPAQMGLGLPILAAFGLHLAWSLPNGSRGPAANALLTEVLPERRGTVISLNSAASSLGVFVGASLGGLIVGSSAGFAGARCLLRRPGGGLRSRDLALHPRADLGGVGPKPRSAGRSADPLPQAAVESGQGLARAVSHEGGITMEMTVLGNTGLRVTKLGFGALELGGLTHLRPITDSEAERAANAVLDAGINYVDTAVCYGLSEHYIGKYISHRRSEFILATKCGCVPCGPGESYHGGRHVWSRDTVMRNIDHSLRTLKTDYVDVLQLHTPTVAEVVDNGLLEAVQEIQASGKARFIGVSSTVPDIEEFVTWNVFSVYQIPYAAFERAHENVITRVARAGAGTVIRGGVSSGEPASARAAETSACGHVDVVGRGKARRAPGRRGEQIRVHAAVHPRPSGTSRRSSSGPRTRITSGRTSGRQRKGLCLRKCWRRPRSAFSKLERPRCPSRWAAPGPARSRHLPHDVDDRAIPVLDDRHRPLPAGASSRRQVRFAASSCNCSIGTTGIPLDRSRSRRSARSGFTATPASVTRTSIVWPGVVTVLTRWTTLAYPPPVRRVVTTASFAPAAVSACPPEPPMMIPCEPRS